MSLAGRIHVGRVVQLPPPEAWLVAGAFGAACFGCAALFGHAALFASLAAGALAAGVAFYEPRTLGPMLALALPLEISKLAFPFLQTRSELGGGVGATSIVDAGRIVVALAFAVWVVRPCRRRADVLPMSPLTLPLALLFAVFALSALYAPDASAARTESLRLLFSLGSFALVPFFVRDAASLRWTLYAVVLSAGALAVVGIYQQFTDTFFWNPGLGLYGERRINATFADPNHFARFLLEAIVLATMLWPFASRRLRFGCLLPAIAASILTIVFTGSRGAWVVGVIVLPAAVLALPLERRLRLRLLAIAGATVAALVLVVAALSPYATKRLDTFTFGFQAAGARPYLVKAGLNMFADHPVTGVGVGGYQYSFENDYFRYKDPKIKANITISHTSVVTIMAELGLVGVVAVAFLALRFATYVRDVLAHAPPGLRATAIALALVVVIIFLGSQTEGRFLEDPYLWLAAGLVVAIDQIARSESAAANGRALRG
jgi:putative inorganic carbon (HCO3(-)) transporter